jgi:hypothetical protein
VPLAEKTRIEVHVPGVPKGTAQELIDSLIESFSHTFGRCTITRIRDGYYRFPPGRILRNPTTLICVDAPLSFVRDRGHLAQYIDQLHRAAQNKVKQAFVLAAAHSIYHSVD